MAWLADTQASALESCEVAPVWVQTPTATSIEGALNYARNRPSIAVVYGGAGVGKLTPAGRLSVAVGYTTALGMHLRLWWAKVVTG